jgi:hypothetical protein
MEQYNDYILFQIVSSMLQQLPQEVEFIHLLITQLIYKNCTFNVASYGSYEGGAIYLDDSNTFNISSCIFKNSFAA